MTEEDDWFERALTEDAETGPDDEDDVGAVDEDDADVADGGDSGPAADAGAEPPDADGEDADEDDGAGSAATRNDSASDDGEALFEDDFASAFEGVDGPGGDAVGGADDGPFGGGSAFGGGGGGDGPFSGGGDDPFGDGGGGRGDPFGEFGVGGSEAGDGTEADFSDEALDSDIDRVDLGIEGLDEMIRGGVPERSLMAIIGSAGTGKTTFGLQFLEEGLSNDEKAIYVTLEESRGRLLRSAEEKGWPFRAYADEGRLAVVDIDPIEMANSLSSIRSELPRLVDEFGASRLVLDSVSLLEMMYEDRATRRNEIYTFARSLKEAGVTVLLTSEASKDDPYASRHGIVEYLTDAVYILQYVRPSDFQETRLAVEIQKIRDAHHSRQMKPYEITDDGISVYRQANIF